MIYPRRYENEPRKRKAYCEACDLIAIYGAERKSFNYIMFGICRTEMKEIWNFATKDMGGESTIDFIQKRRKK